MPDLLEIGAGASIGYGADLEPFVVEEGWLHLAPIRLGKGTFIGTNAVVYGASGWGGIAVQKPAAAQDVAAVAQRLVIT